MGVYSGIPRHNLEGIRGEICGVCLKESLEELKKIFSIELMNKNLEISGEIPGMFVELTFEKSSEGFQKESVEESVIGLRSARIFGGISGRIIITMIIDIQEEYLV